MSQIALADLLEHLEEIGAEEIRALSGAGIFSVDDLEERCTSSATIAELSRRTAVPDARLRQWLGLPLLTCAGPAAGRPDARVVLQGANLGDAPDDGRLVLFQGRPAAIEEWSASRIAVRMPGVTGRGMLFAVVGGQATNAIEWHALAPALVVEGIDVAPARPLAGQPVRLEARLVDDGPAPAAPFDVAWQVGDQPPATSAHGPLQPGQRSSETSLSLDTVFAAGTHVVRFTADPGGRLALRDRAAASLEIELTVETPRELAWGVSDPLAALDPFGSAGAGPFDVVRLVFRGLGRPDPHTGAPVPDLAQSWSREHGGRPAALRVALPAGLRFHDDTPVIAADVVHSYERARAPGSAWRDLLDRLDVTVSARAEDAVVIEATALPAEVLAVPLVRGADPAVGAGPFAVAERRPGERLVLRAHPHHLPAPPRLDRLTVLALAPDDLLARLEAGALAGATLPSDGETADRLSAACCWIVVPLPSAGRPAVMDVQSRALRERAAWHSDPAWNAHLWYVRD